MMTCVLFFQHALLYQYWATKLLTRIWPHNKSNKYQILYFSFSAIICSWFGLPFNDWSIVKANKKYWKKMLFFYNPNNESVSNTSVRATKWLLWFETWDLAWCIWLHTHFRLQKRFVPQLSIFRFAPKPPRLTIVDRNQTYLKGRQVQSDTTPLLLDAHVELSHHFLFQLYHYTVSEHLVTTSKLIGDAHVRMNK